MGANGAVDRGRVTHVVHAALASLEASRRRLDDLNVYPVADGDTGTNMTLTVRAVAEALDGGVADDPAAQIGHAALLGARGNSGVILSQIVRAALGALDGELDAAGVARALRAGSDAAYAAVQQPVEGTILTVVRELAEEAERLAPDSPPLGELLRALVRHGDGSVARTPELLPLLRDAGVVDAGAAGLVEVLRGVTAGVTGEALAPAPLGSFALGEAAIHVEESRFRYCTTFVVEGSGLDRDRLHAALEPLGDSLLVVGDATALKVHVHTDDPGAALAEGTALGVLEGVEIANMRRQQVERSERLEGSLAACAVLAVATGDGIARLFESLGATVLDGGETMNPSTAELVAALDRVPAREAVLLPNDPNVLLAAQAAAQEASVPTQVVEVRSPQAGLSALLVFDAEQGAAANAEALTVAAAAVATGAVAVAARDFTLNGTAVEEGRIVGLVEREPAVAGTSFEDVAAELVALLLAEPREVVTLLAGRDAPPLDALVGRLRAAHPGVELEAHDGGQATTLLLVAAE
jgi:DAK2 domain fusion protein YloV